MLAGPRSSSFFSSSASCILPANVKRAQTWKVEQKKGIIRYLLYVPLLTKSLIASIVKVFHVMAGHLFLK